jgi:hypothetical protein
LKAEFDFGAGFIAGEHWFCVLFAGECHLHEQPPLPTQQQKRLAFFTDCCCWFASMEEQPQHGSLPHATVSDMVIHVPCTQACCSGQTDWRLRLLLLAAWAAAISSLLAALS